MLRNGGAQRLKLSVRQMSALWRFLLLSQMGTGLCVCFYVKVSDLYGGGVVYTDGESRHIDAVIK